MMSREKMNAICKPPATIVINILDYQVNVIHYSCVSMIVHVTCKQVSENAINNIPIIWPFTSIANQAKHFMAGVNEASGLSSVQYISLDV